MILSSLLPHLDGSAAWMPAAEAALIFAVILFAAGAVFRISLGKGSNWTRALCAAVIVLLVYLTEVLLQLFLPQIRTQLPHLPFVYVDQQRFLLGNLERLSEPALFGGLVRLMILSFLVNLLDDFLPKGESFGNWCLWRGVLVVLALALYNFICPILEAAMPALFTVWAKPLILGCWIMILLSGAVKVLMGLILTVVNPLVGIVYAFFFSHKVGSQMSKAILTTLILTAVIAVLNHLEVLVFAFGSFSPAVYAPACVITVVTIYLFDRFL